MAPLRSSRHTRNGEHNAPARNRAGLIDYDPTDGLPVRKYQFETVKVNQDAAADVHETASKTQTDKEGDAYYPWDDLQLPSFIDSLPPHNQELLRRSRQGNRNFKPAVWDRKTGEWIKFEKAKARGLVDNVMKSRHLMNVDADEGENEDDEADEDEEEDEMLNANGPAGKKRKVVSGGLPVERTFEVRKWVAVPADKADKMAEPKYLADRRPGMPSLYTNAEVLKQARGYGAPVTAVNEYSGMDLGDGSGLGSALGGPAAGTGEATPVRKNMPPKRKKKKLGGPGRRKAVPIESLEQTAAVAANAGDTEAKAAGQGEKKEGEAEGEGDEGSGDETEGEGSEEGEVAEEATAPATAPATVSAPVPLVTVEAVTEDVVSVPPVALPTAEEKPPEAVIEEVIVPAASPEKKEPELDLLGGLEAALAKQA